MQTDEQRERKKRKGAPKDGSNKPKKLKKEGKEEGLKLNAAARTVEILHIQVMDLYILFGLLCVSRCINLNIPDHDLFAYWYCLA